MDLLGLKILLLVLVKETMDISSRLPCKKLVAIEVNIRLIFYGEFTYNLRYRMKDQDISDGRI